jgi:hypothetical protein
MRFEPSIMEIKPFVRAVRERKKIMKKIIKGQQLYVSRMCRGGIPKVSELKLGTFVDLVEIINHTNFHLFLMNIFGLVGVKFEDLPLKGIWLLLPCASALACDIHEQEADTSNEATRR